MLFFSLAPAIRVDASCSRLYESHGCKSSHPELFWQRQPSTVGDFIRINYEVTDRFKLVTEQLCEANAALHFDRAQISAVAVKLEQCSSSHKLVKAMDSTASSEPLTPRSTGAPAMIERRSSFVLEGASTKLVDDLAKAAAAARADAILGRAEFVRRSSSIGEEAEVAAAA